MNSLFVRKLSSLPFKNRIRLVILLSCAAATILTTGFLIYFGISGIKQSTLEDTVITAKMVALQNSTALAFDNADFSQNNLKVLGSHPQVISACLYDKDGRLFAFYHRETSTQHCATKDEALITDRAETAIFHSDYLKVASNVYSDYSVSGTELTGRVILYSSLDEIYAYVQKQLIIAACLALIVLTICYFLCCRLEQLISAPVMEIMQAAKNISGQKDYSIRAQNTLRNDELSFIIECFNKILTEREEVHAQYKGKCRDYTEAYERTNLLMNKLLKEFDVPYGALITLAEILQNRAIGSDIDSYMPYISDLGEEMECYRSCMESTLSLTKIYETALLQKRKKIFLAGALKPALARLPEQRATFTNETRHALEAIFVNVHEESFLKSLALCMKFVDLMIYTCRHASCLEMKLYMQQNDLFLRFELKLKSDSVRSCFSDTSSQKLIDDINRGNWNFDVVDDLVCDPMHSLLLNKAGVSPAEYTYFMDSIKYIANADNIEVHDVVKLNAIEFEMNLSHVVSHNDLAKYSIA